jgi:MazG family protein
MHERDGLERLVDIMDRLRGPEGCPWDREQTYGSLRRYLIEECYEVVDALDRDDPAGLREELGDLLFQIVFLSRLAQEQQRFTVDDVVRGIAEKLIRRHPHVFGTATVESAAEVERNWQRIKRDEKAGGTRSLLDGIPVALPATLKAQQIGERAASVGFDWRRVEDVFAQIEDELRELRAGLAGGEADGVRDEIGDVLFSVVMLARRLRVDAEAALQRTNAKFLDRFRWIEGELARRGLDIRHAGFEQLEQLWSASKGARPPS